MSGHLRKNLTGSADVEADAEAEAYVRAYGVETASKPDLALCTTESHLRLRGVHHTARPVWKLRQTVEFYHRVLGLPIVHVISAKGWGPPGHPDFLHFFFDAGNGANIAFFYYLGTERPDYLKPRFNYLGMATHTAWAVNDLAELMAWKSQLESRGIRVSPFTRHEVIESIYFNDPNGYPVEITLPLRPVEEMDSLDGLLTLEAAMSLEDQLGGCGEVRSIEDVWRRKGALVADRIAKATA